MLLSGNGMALTGSATFPAEGSQEDLILSFRAMMIDMRHKVTDHDNELAKLKAQSAAKDNKIVELEARLVIESLAKEEFKIKFAQLV